MIKLKNNGNSYFEYSVDKKDAFAKKVYDTRGANTHLFIDLGAIPLAQSGSGVYTINMFDIEKDASEQKTFYLSNINDYKGAMAGLNLLVNADLSEIADYIEANKDNLEFSCGLYELADKQKTAGLVSAQLKKQLFSETDRESNRAVYRNLLLINGLANKKIDSLGTVAQYSALINGGGLSSWYAGIEEESVQNEILARLNGESFADIEELENKIIEAFVLEKVQHNTGYGEAKKIITQFETKLGITASDYSDTAYSAVSGKDYKNKEELAAALKNNNNSAPSVSYSSSGGGGGKGSSSSYQMSQSVISNATITPVVKEIFSDLGDVEWAKEHIEKLYKNNIVAGDGEGKYLPDNTVTREEFVKMMVLAFDMYSETAKAEFADYAAESVKLLSSNGIINGIDGNFRPLDNSTRAQAAVVISRLCDLK